jgi:NAD(P)H-hydrate epimerase
MEGSMKLVTVEQMRRLEQAADTAGHPYDAMMECAGRAVAEVIQDRLEVSEHGILFLVGPGNNGGDGLVAARYLAQAGARINCYLWKPRSNEDPNMVRLREYDVDWSLSEHDENHDALREALQNADVIVDALLGTGVDRPLGGKLSAILEIARGVVQERRSAQETAWTAMLPPEPCDGPHDRACQCSAPLVVAVDVPSGLNCDTGAVDPATLPADLTVTFAAAKHGQFRFPGAQALGELIVADIGIDPALSADIQTELATARKVRQRMPERPLNAHKGTFGKAMIVAGSANYTGAPYLAAAAAGRVGAGLVTLAPPASIHPIVAAKLVEATYLLLPHNMGVLVPGATQVLVSHLEGYAALLLGPGLGREPETVQFVHRLLGIEADSKPRQIGFQPRQAPSSEKVALPPLVIDADALNALAEAELWWTYLPANSVLTPHPGEMGRLMDAETESVNADRIAVASVKAAEWKQIIVLKGAYTVVAAPDRRTTVIPMATPALATAGTGDVLAGAIVGLLAQGMEPFDAAVCGAYLHGLAGEIVAKGMGDAGALAGDLLPALPQAIWLLKH